MAKTVDMTKLFTKKIVTCDECKTDIKKLVGKTERLTRDRTGYFFCCDKCGHKYPFGAITEKGLVLLEKINKKKRDLKRHPELAKSLHFALRQDLKVYQKEFQDTYTEEDILHD